MWPFTHLSCYIAIRPVYPPVVIQTNCKTFYPMPPNTQHLAANRALGKVNPFHRRLRPSHSILITRSLIFNWSEVPGMWALENYHLAAPSKSFQIVSEKNQVSLIAEAFTEHPINVAIEPHSKHSPCSSFALPSSSSSLPSFTVVNEMSRTFHS